MGMFTVSVRTSARSSSRGARLPADRHRRAGRDDGRLARIIDRALDLLGLENTLVSRWGQ
jgi:hypothetical protein